MDLNQLNEIFQRQMSQAQEFVDGEDIRTIMGEEAVSHFKDSFVNEGFTDETLDKWKDVSRRDPNSGWYGHDGFSENQGKANKKRNKDRAKEGQPALIGRFSQARATDKILTGHTRELREGISYVTTENGARITSSTPYGRVHQFGMPAKIYGKGTFQMPKRPFMGKSVVLKANIEDKIKRELTKIFTKK